jgi:hypothetical protein
MRRRKKTFEGAYECEATIENIKKFRELGYNVLILGRARTGKSFVTQLYWASERDKTKSIWTLAHANRYRFVDEVDKMNGEKNIYDSSVFAAIGIDKDLTKKNLIFIDELGLLGNLDLKESGVVIDWLKQNKCLMTADVHQPVYTNTLLLLLNNAFKYNSEVNKLEKYNQYVLKDELKLRDWTVNKYEDENRFNVKILYASYDVNRPLINDFETNGCKNFVVANNSIDLKKEVENGAKILTLTTETRDMLIEEVITPNWVRELKVGDTLFCHTNEKVSRRERKWWNGLYYTVTDIDGGEIVLACVRNKDNKTFEGDRFGILRRELAFYFQPPYCVCAVKGQGSDFEDVILYLTDKDLKSVHYQFLYLCATRARERFRIVLENSESTKILLRRENFVLNLDNVNLKNETIEKMHLISNFLDVKKENIKGLNSKDTWKRFNEWMNEPLPLMEKSPDKIWISYRNWVIITKKMCENFEEKTSKWEEQNIFKTILSIIQLDHQKMINDHHYIYNDHYSSFTLYLAHYQSISQLTDCQRNRFMNIKTGKNRYSTYYLLGKFFKQLNRALSANEIFFLITYRIFLDDKLTEDFDKKKEGYWKNMLNGINEVVDENHEKNSLRSKEYIKNKTSNDKTSISTSGMLTKEAFYDAKCFVEESTLQTYEGDISGKYSPVFEDGKTRKSSSKWLDNPLDGHLNCYNLYRTPYVVFDIDDMNSAVAQKLHNYFKTMGCPIFTQNNDDGDSKHHSGSHIYVRIDGYIPTKHFVYLKIDFLGNAKHQIVKLKNNKYPDSFKISDIENTIPVISENLLSLILNKLYDEDKKNTVG